MKKQLLLLVLMLVPILANAYDTIIGGIYYNLIDKTKDAEVTFFEENYSSYSGDVIIPEKITYNGIEYTVTAIGDKAFRKCGTLMSVTIPNTVTSIGNYAFQSCSQNLSLNIPNSVTNIGTGAFMYCCFGAISIPNSVTTIGSYAFAGNPYLYSVTIPNSVKHLGNSVFESCSGLFSVILPNTLTEIGNKLFLNCHRLSSVSIPNTVTVIGVDAFSCCYDLTSLTIPNSVTSIGEGAFACCTSLTSVTIPSSVTVLETRTFYKCSSLASIIIPNSVTSINGYVNKAGAFKDCSSLTSVTIGNSVEKIGCGAFEGCTSLSSVTIPNSVVSISGDAFRECSGLTSLSIGNSVASIGEDAFHNCCSLAFIKVEEGNATYDSRNSCNAIIFTKSNSLILGSTNTVIPNTVATIGENAFYGCSGLASLIIPNSVTSIGRSAFYGCSGLASLTIPNSVTNIGASAFRYCSGLTSVFFSNSVINIENSTFADCSELMIVKLGRGIKKIGTYAFSNCPKLTDFYCFTENIPTIYSSSFKDSYIQYATLYVPAKSIEAYQAKSPWSNFKEIVAIEVPKHTLTYTIDGTTYKTYSIEEGETVAPETVPIKEGSTFSGWSEIPSTMPDHDVTVTGTFTVNKYSLTYKVDGTEFKSFVIEYGSTITPEAPPTKEGYTFSGWSDIPSTMPANDVTITGTFTINKYTVTYVIGGDIFKTEEIEYNSAITPPDTPAQEGYSFAWTDVPTTMPAHDITIYGSYTTAIGGIMWNEDEKQVFTPDGKRIETPQKGLNIIRMSDGTTKKVVVK